jgi:putative transcriptional regulator
MERFGEKLRVLREKHGLSYRQLAAELEVSHSHLVRIEGGSKQPALDLAIRIARYFKVSLDDLLLDERNLKR